jgi:hypothetical protein
VLSDVPWSVLGAYAGDALWVIALTIMFAASRQAWARTEGRARLRFAASLWLALQARGVQEEMALIVFGVRAVSASLLALLHLRWLADALKP